MGWIGTQLGIVYIEWDEIWCDSITHSIMPGITLPDGPVGRR